MRLTENNPKSLENDLKYKNVTRQKSILAKLAIKFSYLKVNNTVLKTRMLNLVGSVISQIN